jgi:hypothetical protein
MQRQAPKAKKEHSRDKKEKERFHTHTNIPTRPGGVASLAGFAVACMYCLFDYTVYSVKASRSQWYIAFKAQQVSTIALV